MSRPLLLDLFCGAGGAALGYHRAGFDVVGVDINLQPNYPFPYVQDDAMRWAQSMAWRGHHLDKPHSPSRISEFFDPEPAFAAIHASPPCQRHSAMSSCRPGLAETYPDLIAGLRWRLKVSRLPYVIENVPGSPLHDPITLCGHMFGLELYRHRLFESNIPLAEPLHPAHTKPASKAGHWKPGTVMSVSGHVAPIAVAREAMGIDWMTRDELTEAIPPAYTEYIGHQLLEASA